ncbi:hypothetical protein ON010_g6347 [Phytophthora cinnamomi]|nr:hypothetical protein ON010_g6347 [Phytophthora cinnamomi]
MTHAPVLPASRTLGALHGQEIPSLAPSIIGSALVSAHVPTRGGVSHALEAELILSVVGPLEALRAHCNPVKSRVAQLGHPMQRYSEDERPASLRPLPGRRTSGFTRSIESREKHQIYSQQEEECDPQQRMATSTEPPPKHVKLRYRALAYVRRFGRHHQSPRPRATSRRSFADTGGARSPIRITSPRRYSDSGGARPPLRANSIRNFADSGGARPVVCVTSKRSFFDSSGARPVVRLSSRKSFADSGGTRSVVRLASKRSFADSSNSGVKLVVRRSNVDSNEVASTPPEIKANTRTKRTSRTRKQTRQKREKRRHRFLGGHRLFCGCCVDRDAFDPAETPSFHWGVGFDDSYYHTSSYQHLSKGARFRLELCGLHVTTRGKEPKVMSVDISSVGARAASFDSGFGYTCSSPVSCPPPHGLVPTRTFPTTLQLRSRDGTGSGKFTLNTGNSGFSSTGFKRKAPSSSSYPSYTPTTPPSPFMNDFLPAGTFNATRARSRVSVGCNGWLLHDEDPSVVGWYRRQSSGEVKPTPIITHLSQVAEASQESDAEYDRKYSPKRYKVSPRDSETTSGVSSSLPASSPAASFPSVATSPKPPLVPRPKTSSPASSRGSRVSILLLSHDGSISSSNGENGWNTSSGIALVPLPMPPLPGAETRFSFAITPPPPFASSHSSYSSGLASQTYNSALQWQAESNNAEVDDYDPPTKRWRSTGSSSNSSGGFGFGNMPRDSTDGETVPGGGRGTAAASPSYSQTGEGVAGATCRKQAQADTQQVVLRTNAHPFLFQDGVLETMMIGGLSDELIDSLAEVVASVPSALPYVQERLLNEISGILRGTPFSLGSASAAYPPGSSGGAGSATNGDGSELGLDASYYDTASEAAPMKQTAVQALFSSMKRGFSSAEDDPASSSGSLMIKGETGDEIDTILLSLRTLSCFDFSGSFCLLPFVRDCVALYLKNPDARIRKQAVITCSKLLLPSPESPDTALMSSWRHVKKRGPSGRVIDLVLMQLLQVGISDMDVAVRRSVVESLDARFDELLSQEAHLKLVFLLLNDENANIRERAMQLLERLAPRNPAFVMPSLRRVLIQLVTELQHTSDLRMREDSTRLLGHLIRGAQHLVDPYVVRILEVLLPILVRGNAPLTMAVLVTLGELALVSRTQIAAYERYLFPLIIHTLQDHSSIEKRQVALQTLGQLAGSTGCVVRPYLASPKLLEIFLSLLHHSVGSPWSLRREAMRTIGILGALDPYKYKLCISRASLRQANEVASTADTSTAKEDEEKSADSTTIGVSKSVAGTLVSQYPTLDLDLKALGLTINLASFDRKATSDALDEKQQIELQLFTAAPIGTRKIDAAAAAGTLGVGSQSSHPVSGAAGVSAGAPSSSLSSSSRKRRQVGSIGMSLSDDMFDFESSLMDSELELDPTELSPASEAYFPTVAIHALLRILREPSLNAHHHGVIQAIMFIFKSLSTQCVPFLKYILPPFLRVLARGEPRLRESLFLQLTTLISIVNAHMKPFFPPIMVLALRFWGSHLPQIVRLVEKISQAAPHEFRTQYFPKLLPKLLEVLQPHFGLGGGSTDGELSGASPGVGGSTAQNSGDGAGVVAGSADLHGQVNGSAPGGKSDHALVSSTYDIVQNGTSDGGTTVAVAAIQVQVVQSLIVFGDAVEDYVYLLVPSLVHLMESLDTPLEVKITTIYALARISVVATFEQYQPRERFSLADQVVAPPSM